MMALTPLPLHVVVIIPALNEAGNIIRLVGEVPRHVADHVRVVVVNNGSTDATGEQARSTDALVVDEARRGYGAACAAGVTALSDQPDDTVVVFLDGDGSFDPAELAVLLTPIHAEGAHMVIGSRVRGGIEPGAMPPHQRFGNRLVSSLMGRLYRLTVTDLGPYRAVRLGWLRSLNMQEMTFGWPTEMIVKTARCNGKIVEVPVTYRRRWSGKSKVSGTIRGSLLATYYILGVTLKYAFGVPLRRQSEVKVDGR
jgi:glycosyltransferase involved in cell wall biosynthesis